ncbi:MAG: HIT family protein [Alphaproteobacteria bacterium]
MNRSSALHSEGFFPSAPDITYRESVVRDSGAQKGTNENYLSHPKGVVIAQNEAAYAVLACNKQTMRHILVFPKRSVANIWELSESELLACWALLKKEKLRLDLELAPDGYNMGSDSGSYAGQDYWHAHLYLIPRFRKDCQNHLKTGMHAITK